MNRLTIAMICHAANAALCLANGDNSQKPWEEAGEDIQYSAFRGVDFAIANPDAPDSAQHDAWSKDKIADGWVYGEVKDPVKKTHPCLIAFDKLPPHQQAKDALFRGIVKSLAPYLTAAE